MTTTTTSTKKTTTSRAKVTPKKTAAPRVKVASKEATTLRAKTVPKKTSVPSTLSAPIYTMAGKEAGTISLPEVLFNAPWKDDLVHQVVVAMQANARHSTAKVKDRSEVRGGGRKPWKQKGTGRARHGSIRSPIWVGGGTTHGPRPERSYTQKINRKMRMGAMAAVLSRKFKDGEIIFVDSFSFDAPKTKDAKAAIAAIAKGSGIPMLAQRRNNAALIALSQKNFATEKSFSNFSNFLMEEVRNLNPVDMLGYRYLIIENPAAALETLSARAAVKHA